MDIANIINLEEEEFVGVGVSAESPVVSGGKARKRRRALSSGDSPEKVGETGKIGGYRDYAAEILELVEEMRAYVKADYNRGSRDAKQQWFEKRFATLDTICGVMGTEMKELSAVGRKISKIEWRVRNLVEENWNILVGKIKDEVESVGRQIVKETTRELGEAMEKVRGTTDMVMSAMEQAEGDRNKVIGEVGERLREVKDRTTGVVGKVGKIDEGVAVMGGALDEVRNNMDSLCREMNRMGNKVNELAVEERKRGERVEGGLDPEVVGKKIGGLVVEEVGKVLRRGDGGPSLVGGSESMEVDGEGDWSYARAARRGRRGPAGRQVVLEVEEGKKVEKKELVGALDIKKGEVRVKGLRKQGRNYIIEVHSDEDLNKLRGMEQLGTLGVKVDGEPKKRLPKIIIYDVDQEIGKEGLLEAVRARNPGHFVGMSEEEVVDSFVPEYTIGGGRGRDKEMGCRAWVVRVRPMIFNRLTVAGRVYVGVRCCRVVEHMRGLRCFKCLGFGHTQERCARDLCCGWCGSEGHRASNCPRGREDPKCINCKRAGYKELCHPAMFVGCPVNKVNTARLVKMTDYGD